jgi:hypothetical protein
MQIYIPALFTFAINFHTDIDSALPHAKNCVPSELKRTQLIDATENLKNSE